MSQLILKVTGSEQNALGSNAEMRFDVNGGTIGRAQSNTWALPDPACYLSSQHALISFQNDKFYITDLSSNGTFINGQDTPLGKNNTACTDDISSLSMGPYQISLELQNAAATDDNQAASLTAMFAPQDIEPAPPQAAPAPSFNAFDETPDNASDPLALLGGSPEPVADFPEDWAAEESSSAQNSFDQRDMIPSNQINDAFTPPQTSPTPSGGGAPDLPPENWDDTMFTPASIPMAADTAPPKPFEQASPASAELQQSRQTPDAPTANNGIPDDPDFFGSSPTEKAPQAPVTEQTPTESSPSFDDATLVGLNTHDTRPETSSGEAALVSQQAQVPPSATADSPPLGFGASAPAVAPTPPAPSTSHAVVEKQAVQPDNSQAAIQTDSLKVAEATFRANGLDPALLADPEFIDQAVALLPYFLEGTLNILQSRAQVKNELRASKTIFQAIDNNPMKYSVNVQDAIQNLFTHRRPGFLSPNDAIKEAFVDIGKHETALVSGIQGGLNGLLEKIKPETIEHRIEANESKKNLFGKISSSKKWDFYKETYSHITDTSGDSFLELFGADFLNAYEAHINQKD